MTVPPSSPRRGQGVALYIVYIPIKIETENLALKSKKRSCNAHSRLLLSHAKIFFYLLGLHFPGKAKRR